MARPLTLQDDFSGGANQDLPRYALPKRDVWQVTDMVPNREGAGLTRRGAWQRSYDAMTAASTSYAAGVGFAVYSGPTLLGFDEDGRLYKWAPGAAAITDVGAARLPAHPPTYYRGLSALLDVSGATAPMKYDGTTLAALGGSPPSAAVSTVYKDHLVVGFSAANQNRVWFSNAGNPEGWDTAADGQWLDCSLAVRGLATIRNMLLVFEEGRTERIRGDIIPGVVGSDMVKEPLLEVGCSDPASIAVTNDVVVFANGAGIFRTDGIGVVDVTAQCGMSQFWSDTLAGYDGNWTIAGAVWKNWYVFSVLQSTTLKLAGMIHLQNPTWVTLTNIATQMMVSTPIGASNIGSEWLWMAERGSKNVASLAALLDRGNGTTDGDGTALTCSVETGFFMGGQGKSRWKNLYAHVYSNDTITLTTSRLDSRSDTSYATVDSRSINGDVKKRIPLRRAQTGVALKLAFGSGSATTVDLYAIEAELMSREPSRL